MRRLVEYAMVLLTLAAIGMASNDTASELKARADAAHGGGQVKLCLEYAHQQLESANDLFNAGNADKAQSDIREVVEYAQKAAQAASSSGKHLKDTEINLRKLEDRMHDIGESLDFEDRTPVRSAVDQIEKIRSDLLVRMFGPQAEPKGKS